MPCGCGLGVRRAHPAFSQCTGRGSCCVCPVMSSLPSTLLPVVRGRWRESKGTSPSSLPPNPASSLLAAARVGQAVCGGTSGLRPGPCCCSRSGIPERAWRKACVSLAMAPGWVGAETLFSVYFSPSSRGDAPQAGFSKRAWAVQPGAAGQLPGCEKAFEASRPCRAPRPSPAPLLSCLQF